MLEESCFQKFGILKLWIQHHRLLFSRKSFKSITKSYQVNVWPDDDECCNLFETSVVFFNVMLKYYAVTSLNYLQFKSKYEFKSLKSFSLIMSKWWPNIVQRILKLIDRGRQGNTVVGRPSEFACVYPSDDCGQTPWLTLWLLIFLFPRPSDLCIRFFFIFDVLLFFSAPFLSVFNF